MDSVPEIYVQVLWPSCTLIRCVETVKHAVEMELFDAYS